MSPPLSSIGWPARGGVRLPHGFNIHSPAGAGEVATSFCGSCCPKPAASGLRAVATPTTYGPSVGASRSEAVERQGMLRNCLDHRPEPQTPAPAPGIKEVCARVLCERLGHPHHIPGFLVSSWRRADWDAEGYDSPWPVWALGSKLERPCSAFPQGRPSLATPVGLEPATLRCRPPGLSGLTHPLTLLPPVCP